MQQFSTVNPIFDGLTRKNGVNQSGLQDMIDRINKNADLNAYFVRAVSNNDLKIRLATDDELKTTGAGAFFVPQKDEDNKYAIALHPAWFTRISFPISALGTLAHEMDHYFRVARLEDAQRLVDDLTYRSELKGADRFTAVVTERMQVELLGWYRGIQAMRSENGGADAQLTSLQRRTMTGPESLILQVEEQGRKLGKTGGALQDYVVENGTGLLSRSTVGYWEDYSKGLDIRFGLKAGEADSIRKQLAYAYSDPGGVVDWDLVRLPEGGEQVTLSYLDHRVVRTYGIFGQSSQTEYDPAGNLLARSTTVESGGIYTTTMRDGQGSIKHIVEDQRFDDGTALTTIRYDDGRVVKTTWDGSQSTAQSVAYEPWSPTGATTNIFDLTTSTLSAAEREGAADPQANAAAVADGLVSSGGGWQITTDPKQLNDDSFINGIKDNTANAAFTQILSDGWRPGNGNLVGPVIDRVAAANGAYGWGSVAGQNASFGLSGTPVQGIFLNTANAQARVTLPTDPLVLDLNGDGVRLTSYVNDPVLFDTDNDGGSLERTGWVSKEDGIVVVDRNNNGRIDNISETLSEYYGGAAGSDGAAGAKTFRDGFAALKSLDSNDDNVFDSRDASWGAVKVWVDSNHDGKSWNDANGNGVVDASEASELRTLSELGITQINLANTAQSGAVRDGNEVLAQGTFVQNGQTREALAANFLANPNGHTFAASGAGTVVSTEGGAGAAATSSYVAGNAAGETIDVAEKGVRSAVGGKGDDLIKGDANNNWLAGGAGKDSLDGGAGDDVLLIDAEDTNVQGGAGTDIAQVVGDRGVTLNLAQSGIEIAQGGRGNDVFIGGGRSSVFMSGGDGDDILIGGGANDAINGDAGDDQIDGGAGNDVLRGHRGRDILAGGLGDDYLDGGLDDDTLSGGAGNDILKGGAGDDILDGGDGTDVVELSGSYSEYRFTRTDQGVWVSDTVAGRDGTDFLRNIEKANFKDVSLVDIPGENDPGLDNPLPVKDVLTRDKSGALLGRTAAHLLAQEQLLANDIDWQGDTLRISELFDVLGGTARITQSGDVLFTPDAGFTGMMGFKYTVVDSKGNTAAMVVQDSTGKRAVMRAAVTLRTPDMPSDPALADQWYLSDANILPVWRDYSGKGVRIGEFETTSPFGTTKEILDTHHPDLKANRDAQWLAETAPGRMAGEGSEGKYSEHATLVAGVMVAARNGEGGVGVAYGATLGGHWLDSKDLSSLDRMKEYDVVNHSWGATANFDARFTPTNLGLMPQAYRTAVANGRNGLGTVMVAAGGNDRVNGGNANYTNLTNTRTVTAVGAINANTDLGALQVGGTPFSNPGANLLVSAPGSNIASTNRLQQNENGSTFGADSTTVQGTSFATPIVSGIVALMLEANANLGYRDVQEILALSARKVSDPDATWQTNGSKGWNGGGMHVSHDYGYGEVDARAAVRLAETWINQQTYSNERLLSTAPASGALALAIPDGGASGVSHALAVSGADLRAEYVEIRVSLTHARPGDLILKLVSPSGTESILMDRPGKKIGDATSAGDATFNGSNTLDYVFSTARHRGEDPNGTWIIKVTDTATGASGTLNNWSFNVFGSGGTANDHYVYTNEYAQLATVAGRNSLNDTDGGRDTINVAAVASASRIDLTAGTATVAGAALHIQNSGQIENVLGGEFNDTLIGNAASNILMGGRGDDTLDGRDGQDTLDGGFGNDTLSGGAGSDLFVIGREAGAQDTILDFGAGASASVAETIALVGFGGLSFASLARTQVGADVRLDLGEDQTLWLRNVQLSQLKAGQFQFFADQAGLQRWQVGFAGSKGAATEGDDLLTGTAGPDTLFGLGGNDTLLGNGGNDGLVGGAGVDTLDGGAGNDVLVLDGDQGSINFATGVTGAGVRIGGPGADRFLVAADGGGAMGFGMIDFDVTASNLITDFEVGADRIDLSQFNWVTSFNQLTISKSFNFNGAFITRVLAGNGSQAIVVHLYGVDPAALNAGHFIFAGSADATPMPQPAEVSLPVAGAAPNVFDAFAAAPAVVPVIRGTTANDVLIGDSGGNILDGGAGADRMEGRTGDDTYMVDNAGDTVIELGGGGYDLVKSSVSYTLADEVEALELTGSGAINGTGNGLANRIVGNAENNVLDGAGGADTLVGHAGDDTYIVDDGADRVIERENEGVDTVKSSVSFTLADNLENLVLTGTAAVNATGNSLANQLTGNAADNRLDGAGGADRMAGGAGNDTYLVDNAGDVVVENAGEGIDTVVSTVDQTLAANVENLILVGSAINGIGNALDNELRGNSANNHLTGGAGNDWLDGGQGADTLVGGAGDDTYVVDQAGDTIIENAGEGNDTVISANGWSIAALANVENITLTGSAAVNATGNGADNVLIGNEGKNILDGGAGNDTLVGAAGDDTLKGGTGDDRYVFRLGDGQDTIIEDLAAGGGTDTIAFGAGIAVADVTIEHSDLGMVLKLANGQQVVSGWNATAGHAIERIEFADGTVLSTAMMGVRPNHLPIVSAPIADQSATEDALFRFVVPASAFTDADVGDVLKLTATRADGKALPGWLSFDAATRTFSGVPTNDDVGSISIKVIATDLAGASVSDVFDVNVANTNDAPTPPNYIVAPRVTQGKELRFAVPANAFTDVYAGDQLTYRATLADGSALPAWLTFDARTRTFQGTPSRAGKVSLRISATDLAGASASKVFDIIVITRTLGPGEVEGIDAPADDLSAGQTINGLRGNVTLSGTGGDDVLSGGDGDDVLNGEDGDDVLNGGGGADRLYGGRGDDVLDGGAGNDALYGGKGNDTYRLDRGAGQDTIDDFDTTVGNTDVLQFGGGIAADQLWFRKANLWDLEVSIIGTGDKVTIRDWDFWHKGSSWENAQHIEQFKTADGQILLDSQVDQLVTAMAAFAPPGAGQTTLPASYQSALAPVLAANWK
ncbi:putative Ig domain-containing protein [Cupriavidus basilensis]